MEKRRLYSEVANLHAQSIDQGFLTTLGTRFLELLYQAIDEVPQCILIVEEKNGRVVGFVSAGIGMRPIYQRMFQSPARLFFALAPSLLRPSRVLRILETLRYSRRTSDKDELPDAELLSLAVLSEYRGQGIANRLYRQLCSRFADRRVSAFKIVVGEGLTPAHGFYQRMGARPVSEVRVHPGTDSVVYLQCL